MINYHLSHFGDIADLWAMKKNEVPQDDEKLLEGKFKVVKYAVDESGNYDTIGSVGWEPENTALNQAWDKINEQVEATRQKVEAGELSPLAFHMEKKLMDPVMLGQYMSCSKRKIMKHLQPKGFNKLDEATLAKYAEVLEISIEELKTTK